MSGGLPALTGPELIKLLTTKDGWKEDGRRTHGISLKKEFRELGIIRSTVISTKNESIPKKTLMLILGPKQTNIGSSGLRKLLKLK